MRISHFFIDRPIFAAVVSLVITIIGAIGYFGLRRRAAPRDHAAHHHRQHQLSRAPARRPSPTPSPPPIEQEVNGVEGMIYMSSQSTSDGTCRSPSRSSSAPTSTRRRCWCRTASSAAEPRLPDEVRRNGVTVRKRSPDLLLAVHLHLARQHLRPGLHLQLRPAQRARQADARSTASATWRSSACANIRCASGSTPSGSPLRGLTAEQVLDALAGAERAGRRRRAGRAAGRRQERLPDLAADQGAIAERRRVREHHRQDRRRRARRAHQGIGRVELGALSYATHGYRRQVRRPSSSSSCSAAGLQRRRTATQGIKRCHGRDGEDLSRRGSSTASPTIPPSSSRSRSRSSTAPSSRRSFWSSWSCCCSSDLARDAHPGGGDPGVAGRHVRGHGRRFGLLAQHADPVRPGAGGRHRRRRRHRRGRERRAQAAGGPDAHARPRA